MFNMGNTALQFTKNPIQDKYKAFGGGTKPFDKVKQGYISNQMPMLALMSMLQGQEQQEQEGIKTPEMVDMGYNARVPQSLSYVPYSRRVLQGLGG